MALLRFSPSSLVAYSDFDSRTVASGAEFVINEGLRLHGPGPYDRLRITNVQNPTCDSDVATKQYVDQRFNGLTLREPCRLATVEHIALHSLTPGCIVDGVQLRHGDRVLVKDQIGSLHNGVYLCTLNGAVRTADVSPGRHASGLYMFVDQGEHNRDRSFVCISDAGQDVVDTHGLSWATHGSRAADMIVTQTNVFTQPNVFQDTVECNDTLRASANQPSTSQDTGSIVVMGGIGCSGSVHCSGVFNHSDRNLKEDLVCLSPGALEIIQAISGYAFTWKDSGKQDVGVVAQELIAAGAPLCVATANDATMSVNYSKVIPYLIEAIKTLQRRMDTLSTCNCQHKAGT